MEHWRRRRVRVCGIILESIRENNRVGCAHGRRVSSGAAASLSFGYVLDMGACFTLGSSNTPFEQHRLQQPRSTTFNYFLNNTLFINSKFYFKKVPTNKSRVHHSRKEWVQHPRRTRTEDLRRQNPQMKRTQSTLLQLGCRRSHRSCQQRACPGKMTLK